MKSVFALGVVCLFSAHWTLPAGAQVPKPINYQGRLLDGTNLVSGTVGLSLRLYAGPAGGALLFEDSNTVLAVDGLYATQLGDQTSAGDFLSALTNTQVWIETAVNGTTLAPREQLVAVAYALATRGLLVDQRTNTVFNPHVNTPGPTVIGSALGGGAQNGVGNNSDYSVVAGGLANGIGTNSVWAAMGGGHTNAIQANSAAATIAGGRNNLIATNSDYASIVGGLFNRMGGNSLYAFVGGGANNSIGSGTRGATIGGGENNALQGVLTNGTIAGGGYNLVATGAQHAAIGGGVSNRVTGAAGTVPGGDQNVATNHAFAAGRRAKAQHGGAWVWGDSSAADVASTNDNSVTMRAGGGYRLFSNTNLTLGAQLAPNATAWAALSDRTAKENFEAIAAEEILARVAALPLMAWTYKHDPTHRRYIGPVAQDFHAAFGLGDDRTINTLDTDGVALAAIQALAADGRNQRSEASVQSARIQELEQTILDLRARLDALEGK